MGEYAEQLLNAMSRDVEKVFSRHGPAQPKASLHTRFGSREITLPDVARRSKDLETIIVVEDISLEWMVSLGQLLVVAPSFFAGHVKSFSTDPWTTIMGDTPTQTIQQLRRQQSIHVNGRTSYWHVDAVSVSQARQHFNRQARQAAQTRYGLNVAARLSFWHDENTTLILVDAPASDSCKVHFPVSNNRGGLILPWIKDQSVYDCVYRFFSHAWHINAIYSHRYGIQGHTSISPAAFCYLLVVSTWKTILLELDSTAKHIGFVEIRTPTVAINNQLHDLRRDVDILQKEVSRTIEWLPGEVQQEMDLIAGSTMKHVGSVEKGLERLLVEADLLERLIMNSFTLLLSSINVHQAEATKDMTRRAQQLTALAFIYIPLTFVTGIFGMNLTEINGSPVPAWVAVATLAVVLVSTAMAFMAFGMWQQHKDLKHPIAPSSPSRSPDRITYKL